MNYEALKIATQVDSRNQMKNSPSVRFENAEGGGIRVLFIGNSITLHAPSESIGWLGDWGMAASAKEKDYVHLLEAHIREKDGDAAFCICNAALWERNYKNPDGVFSKYEGARIFDADVIIVKLCGNSPYVDFDAEAFTSNFGLLLDFLNGSGKAKIIVATEFHHHPAESALIAFAEAHAHPLCYLSDLGDHDEYKAIGLFEHGGVAGHPGDVGMREIADRIAAVLDKLLTPTP